MGGGRGQTPFNFPARYAGECACCGWEFAVGTLVEYNPDNVLVIKDCSGDPPWRDVPSEPACAKCFLVHAKAQEECA